MFVVDSTHEQGRFDGIAVIFPPRRGVGFDVSVHPDCWGTELGRELTLWAEAKVRQEAGASEVIEVDVIDCDSAKRDTLSALGYTCAAEPHSHYTTRSLSGSIPRPLLPSGFSIRSAKGEDEAEALGVVHAASFGSTWAPGAYLRVMRTPGYDAENELVAVAPDGQLAAFLILWPDYMSGSGLFEPVGCHKDFRRLGLARALLYEGMRRLKDKGINVAVVEPLVPAENPAAYALYQSVGFKPLCSWIRYRKVLP